MTRIRELRKTIGLTAKELARKTGLHPVTIYRYEEGHRAPDLKAAEKIAKVLGCSINDMIEPKKAG